MDPMTNHSDAELHQAFGPALQTEADAMIEMGRRSAEIEAQGAQAREAKTAEIRAKLIEMHAPEVYVGHWLATRHPEHRQALRERRLTNDRLVATKAEAEKTGFLAGVTLALGLSRFDTVVVASLLQEIVEAEWKESSSYYTRARTAQLGHGHRQGALPVAPTADLR